MKNTIALYEELLDAKSAALECIEHRFDPDGISLICNKMAYQRGMEDSRGNASTSDMGPLALRELHTAQLGSIMACGPLAEGLDMTTIDRLHDELNKRGVPERDVQLYENAIRDGLCLVCVRSEDSRADDARDLLSRFGVVDIDRLDDGRREGFASTAFASNTARFDDYSTSPASPEGTFSAEETDLVETDERMVRDDEEIAVEGGMDREVRAGEEVRMPVIEEELRIGKQEVETGGVRAESHTREIPVEKDVTLHEERVVIDRRPTDRPATERDFHPEEEAIEVRETSEELIAEKRPRVVEEVVIRKEEQDRTETVRDTVRRKDVDVERIDERERERTNLDR